MSNAELVQGTDEWREARLGKVTASRVADVLATTKSGYGASRKNYMAELLVERLTGQPYEHFTSKEMLWGLEYEELARQEYAVRQNIFVEEVGFIDHPTIPMCGASPDGLVETDGGIEIKCPNTATHIETIRTDRPDPRYFPQMQWNMACTGREWWDFVSYDPRMPIGLQLFITTVARSDDWISGASVEVEAFLQELNELEQELREIGLRRNPSL